MEQVKDIIKALKRERMRKHSALEIMREAGMSVSQISHIESGEIDIRLSTLVRYCHAIGVSIKFERTDQ